MKIAVVSDTHLCEGVRCRKDNYLEAMLDKIAYIADRNDKVIFLGDLFDRPSTSTLFFNTIYRFFSQPKYKGKFISILGNHDVAFRNENALDRTIIGSLELTGVLKIVRDTFTIDNTTFDISSCKKDLSKLGDEDNCKILLSHNYIEYSDAEEESFTRDELKELNYYIVFCGHDHSPYETERIGNTTLIRMGSLCRKDTQTYNKDRKIYYYQLDSVTLKCIKLEVPSKPVNECYIEGAFNKSSVKQKSNYAGLSTLLEKFDRKQKTHLKMPKVIKEMGGKDTHISYLRGVHRDLGIPFD